MNNAEFYEKLKEHGLVVVVRAPSVEEGLKIVRACKLGGIRLIEITFTVPRAEQLIVAAKEEFGDELVIGAGTVLSVQTAKIALLSGADFIVSPNLNLKLLEFSKKNGIAYTPGVLTPTEVVTAIEGGAKVLKLFPGDIAKPAGLKALRGPFPDIKIMPTGGVSFDNLEDWFKAGAVAVGAGSNLTAKAKSGDFTGVAEDAARWVERIIQLR
jgi:Entner-Doudoroff aldolase